MAAIPPQFLKNAKPAMGAASALPKDKKKMARQAAIANMQKQDAKLDAKLGPNDPADTPAKGGSQPPWLKKGN